MAKRHRSVEIYNPTLGIKADAPADILDVRSMPFGNVQNFKCYYGICQKEYGTSLYATATGAVMTGAPTLIYEAQFPDSSILQAHTPTAVYKYTAGTDMYVSDGQVFAGTYTDFWSGIMHNDAYVYCNGIAPIQLKSSFSATGTNMQSAVNPTTYSAWSLLSMRDHLLMYHVFENGGEYFKRVRWSKKGALTYIAGTTDFASGVAGGLDIQDGEGELKCAVPLSGGAAVYFEHCIHYQFWVGGDEVWRFQKVVPGIGTPGRRTVVSYADVNYFLSHENVYAFAGGSDLRPIGNPVKQAMFSEINRQFMNTSFVDFDPRENELYVYVPTGTSTQPDTCWVYRVADDAWSRKLRPHSASGKYSRASGLTIGDLVGNIGAQNFTFGEALVRVDAEVKLFGDPSGRIVKHDITKWALSQTGSDVAQTFVYETPDIVGSRVQGSYGQQQAVDPIEGDRVENLVTNQRWQRCTVNMYGNGTALVAYSTDRGSTFRNFDQGPITLANAPTSYMLDMDVSNPFLRVRVSNTGQNEFIGVKYIKLDFIPGPNW